MKRQISLSGKSESTLKNYAHHVAQMALHFGEVPTKLDEDQINDYLYLLQQQHKTPSESYFKFTVYGLALCLPDERLAGGSGVSLPSIRGRTDHQHGHIS